LGSSKFNKLIEVFPFESRAVDSGHEVLQIPASTFEQQVGENGKDSPCYRRQVYLIKVGSP